MTKPLERPTHIDVYFLMKQASDGKLFLETTGGSDLGLGYYTDITQAQHKQTLELLKGFVCHVYHIQWPLK